MNKEADDILREDQEQAAAGALKFRRWPLRSVGVYLGWNNPLD